MKSKVLEIMIKNGNNPKEAKKDVNKYYSQVVRIYCKYEKITNKKIAEIIKSFACS